MGMALDEPRDDEDHIFDNSGISYIINKGLFEEIKPVKVDYVETPMGSGFNIASNMPQGATCGGSCSC